MSNETKKKQDGVSTLVYRAFMGISMGVCVYFSGRVTNIQDVNSDTLERIEIEVKNSNKRMNQMEIDLDNHAHAENRINNSQWREIDDIKQSIPEFRQRNN